MDMIKLSNGVEMPLEGFGVFQVPGPAVCKPADYDALGDKKYPAVTVAHPNGGVKEQVAGLFAQKLAEMGYVAIAADASYQGESGGEPRQRDYPANRIDDVSGMVDFLTSLSYVDKDRIASLGICGGGGYTLAAAQTDKRIKAVATLSMFNTGRVRRNGFMDGDTANIQTRLQKAAQARNKELENEIMYEGDNPPMMEEQLRALMILFEFCDIFRCNGSKVENKSIIGVLGKDITEDIFHFLSAV